MLHLLHISKVGLTYCCKNFGSVLNKEKPFQFRQRFLHRNLRLSPSSSNVDDQRPVFGKVVILKLFEGIEAKYWKELFHVLHGSIESPKPVCVAGDGLEPILAFGSVSSNTRTPRQIFQGHRVVFLEVVA